VTRLAGVPGVASSGHGRLPAQTWDQPRIHATTCLLPCGVRMTWADGSRRVVQTLRGQPAVRMRRCGGLPSLHRLATSRQLRGANVTRLEGSENAANRRSRSGRRTERKWLLTMPTIVAVARTMMIPTAVSRSVTIHSAASHLTVPTHMWTLTEANPSNNQSSQKASDPCDKVCGVRGRPKGDTSLSRHPNEWCGRL